MIGIELLASATEFLCGVLVLAAFFPKKEIKKWYKWSAVIFGGVVHISLSMYSGAGAPNTGIVFTLILVNWFLLCELCCSGDIWKKVLVILLFWATTYAIDISILAVCMTITNQSIQLALSASASYLFSLICARSLLLSISFGCSYVVKRQQKKQKEKSVIWVFLILIPLYTILGTATILSNTIKSGMLPGNVIIFSGGLLCINVLLCLVVNKLEQNRRAQEEKQRLQTEAAYNLQLAETYQESFRQQRKITHDFRNQLDVLGGLLAQKEYDRVQKYVQHLLSTSQDLTPLINTNHPMINAVLNQKYQLATEREIRMLVSCNDLSDIPIEDGDLVTLLGNLLDNAIAASAQSKEKYIWVRIWEEQGVYQLVVRNSCSDHPHMHSKQECKMHGFGLGLIRSVLEKYGYPFHAEQIDSLYVFSAILG